MTLYKEQVLIEKSELNKKIEEKDTEIIILQLRLEDYKEII